MLCFHLTLPINAYREHSIRSLQSEFRFHSLEDIRRVFQEANCLYSPAFRQLKNEPHSRQTRCPDHEIEMSGSRCLKFLQEKKFCELEKEICEELKRLQMDREKLVEEATAAGQLQKCQVCFREDCLQSELVPCSEGHSFCKDCVVAGAAVAIGEAKSAIYCFGKCGNEIGMAELKKVLSPSMLEKLLERKWAEEVSSAGIANLVSCPFCLYKAIMEDEYGTILACRNPACGRDSCLLCNEPCHVPFSCDEERPREESRRKLIEEQLTGALVRECNKCRTRFLKTEGCNKMTCPSCDAKMCYICKQPVQDYQHFYGQGGGPSATKTCPMFSDTDQLHRQEVALAARKASEQLVADNLQLKHDPTQGIGE